MAVRNEAFMHFTKNCIGFGEYSGCIGIYIWMRTHKYDCFPILYVSSNRINLFLFLTDTNANRVSECDLM